MNNKQGSIIQAVEQCLRRNGCSSCENCPYTHVGDGFECREKLRDDIVALLKAQEPITGETSDGYHTFNELYHHRAVLFSVIVANYPDRAWKSKKHHDGTMYDNMFIVGIDTPDGQATYHYDVEPYWDMFKCRVLDNAPEWDGHTPAQAIERIGKLKSQQPRVMTLEEAQYALHNDIVIWLEIKSEIFSGLFCGIRMDGTDYFTMQNDDVLSVTDLDDGNNAELYGKGIRVWTSRPDEKVRAETPWQE